MLHLSPSEKQEIIDHLEKDQCLPDRYRFLLFENRRQVELLWSEKSSKVTQVELPFQTIEQIDEPRTETQQDSELLDISGRQIKDWTNKLIWGDNKYVLSSLKTGSLRREIEENGGIKLIYIDPPFDVGADFKMNVPLGEDTRYEKQPNILEEIAYRDTWGSGQDSFLSMIYERLLLIKNLLADDGSIYLHCDYRLNSSIRLIMDEIFGKENFRNEIVWCYTNAGGRSKNTFSHKHDIIFFYSKTDHYFFNSDGARVPYEEGSSTWKLLKKGGSIPFKNKAGKKAYTYTPNPKGKVCEDVWRIQILNQMSKERLGYPTQKPEELLERIIKASSGEGDIVCDFFVGSGTTAAVCEKLNRKWICTDLGKFAVHTTRKRLIHVQRTQKQEGKEYRPFEILSLGKYQRKYYLDHGYEERDAVRTHKKKQRFEALILSAYQAQSVSQYHTFQGLKNQRFVSIGPVNSPVSRLHIDEVIKEALSHTITKVDVLGFEYEYGLFPHAREEATTKGIDIQYKQIPGEVFDKRTVERGEVKFYDVSYIKARPIINGRKLSVKLEDFAVFYNLEDKEHTEQKLKNGKSCTIICEGQVIRISKDERGIITNERMTSKWSDWIDYWSVDFDFESCKEMIRTQENGNWQEKWTGDYIFDNQWQSFRTRDNPQLELETRAMTIEQKKQRKIAIKVVDIFGNDTMKIIDLHVK